MPNIKSAKKRVLITKKKNSRNRSDRSKMNNAIKAFNKALDTANLEEAERLLPISKRLSDVKSGKLTITVKKDNKTIAAEKALAAKQAREAARAEIRAKQAEKEAEKTEQKKKKTDKVKAEPTEEKKAKKSTKAAAEKPEAEKAPAKKPAAKKSSAKKSEE